MNECLSSHSSLRHTRTVAEKREEERIFVSKAASLKEEREHGNEFRKRMRKASRDV